ncbi:DUF2818 family protein [Sphaerotilus sp.]|uniref:DUF2818 family protein n=1 Tax=Sphaerotilus sp. TaxID=2093942 RepID=UPI0034E27C2A
MTSAAAIWLVLLLAAVLANLPFINERIFALGPRKATKAVSWRLLELILYTAVVTAVGRWLEGRSGQMAEQGWQFYAVLSCVMLTLAFPGFVWRHLRRRH